LTTLYLAARRTLGIQHEQLVVLQVGMLVLSAVVVRLSLSQQILPVLFVSLPLSAECMGSCRLANERRRQIFGQARPSLLTIKVAKQKAPQAQLVAASKTLRQSLVFFSVTLSFTKIPGYILYHLTKKLYRPSRQGLTYALGCMLRMASYLA
jgi:hypothetical protein